MAAATAVVLLGGSVAPFLAPPVVRFEQERAGAPALTGFTPTQLDVVTGALLADLVLWRGDFETRADADAPRPVLSDAERAHMRDVRGVFSGFWILVLAGIAVLALGFRAARGTEARAAAWSAVARGARGLAVAIVALGIVAVFAFEPAFEVFHRLFFSAGSYTFNPVTDRLVQLFPLQFWSEITVAVGAAALALSLASWWQARSRARG